MKKPVLSFFLILVGILAIVLAISCFNQESGGREERKSYGGDAYTGIQNAAAQTSRNVYYTNDILKFGFGSVLLVAGVAMAGTVAINMFAFLAGFSSNKASSATQNDSESSESNEAQE